MIHILSTHLLERNALRLTNPVLSEYHPLLFIMLKLPSKLNLDVLWSKWFCFCFFYYPHHMNMIIDRFAAKVGEPWILQTNLTKCFVLQHTMWQDKFYIEKKQTQKRKKKRKRKNKHLIYTSFIPVNICSIMVKRLLKLSLQ